MKKLSALALTATLLATGWSAPASAAAIDEVKACFADSTTGRDRKMLARWVFLAMAAHPDIRAMSAATQADIDQSNRDLAALFMRLVTEDCNAQMRRTLAESGNESVKSAFEYLGQMAMMELMAHQDVTLRIGEFEKYVDLPKVQAALQLQ